MNDANRGSESDDDDALDRERIRLSEASPRAPSRAVWETLTPAERAAFLERLGPMPEEESFSPESDWHVDAVRAAEDALDGVFRKRGRGVYIGRNLTVYYPEERRFAPDLFAVLDVDLHKRSTWNVLAEGRGLDFVLEVHWGGRKRKDAELNVARFARMGIPEYFLFDARRNSLRGWRLEGAEPGEYVPVIPQNGRWAVRTLGLELGQRDGLPRWYEGMGLVPLARELNEELARSLDEALERMRRLEAERDEQALRAQAEALRAQAEALRAQTEAERAQTAEAEISRLRAELARLNGEG